MSQSSRRRNVCLTLFVTGFALAGCAPDAVPTDASPSTGSTPTVSATAPADRRGTIEVDGARVAYSCRGQGKPAVVLEAGTDSPGINSFPEAMVVPIAEVTTVCTYNRLGTGGGTDAPPDRSRSLDDLIAVLDGTLEALQLEPPYVMAGQSGGGNVAIAYARAHPDRVAALIPIEAYRDDPAKMRAEQKKEGFTWADNPEHMDWVQASVAQAAYDFPFGSFPVAVISASDADPGGPQNQAAWLAISPNSDQVVIEGPHDLQVTASEQVAARIVDVVRSVR